ncbi:MAG: aminoglycoside phosphotransferase family protein [Rickettsiales bacterium]|jgi:aminoglycoside 2''-phosphotransferase|nr:aminoglycoside phosphotransferase family protein [Rickettsiales bacterium]
MYKDTILKYFPMDIKNYEFIANGWESDIVIINKELVFRFPKPNNRFDCVYEKEKTITDKIKPYITKAIIPSIKIYDTDKKSFSFLKKKKDYSKTFCVLNYIPSMDLEHANMFENIDTKQPNIVDDLTNFIKEMHSISISLFEKDKLDANNLPFYKYKLTMNNLNFNYDNLLPFLKTNNLEDDFNCCLQIFSDFEWKDEDNVLCHNDLHQGNIMVDNVKMNGIIDFGDTIYTNYNVEFISILKWQKPMAMQIAKKYEKITGRKLNFAFILSVIKLNIYAKVSVKINESEKYLQKIKTFI